MDIKVIVAHSGQQHSYKTATALKKHNMLCKYITTVYNKPHSWTRFICKFLKGDNLIRGNSRNCPDLDNSDVLQIYETWGLMLLLLQRIDKKRNLYNFVASYISKYFGVKVAKYAIKHNIDVLIVYDSQGLHVGEYLKKKKSNIKLVMDVAGVNPLFIKHIFEKDLQIIDSSFKSRVLRDYPWINNNDFITDKIKELGNIDYYIAASNFTKKTFKFSDICENKIYLCPYGSYFQKNSNEPKIFNFSLPLRLVYVGQVTETKGIWYLLEAMLRIPKEKAILKIVGNFDNSDGVFDKYINRVEFTGFVVHSQVKKHLENSDAFIIASLYDGMALVVLEALGMGLPCLVSENVGASDFIKEKENGLIFPIQDIDAIVKSINWLIDNRNLLPQMSQCALETAKLLTWERYYDNIANIIIDIQSK